eukprot:CAMPEP_0176490156 /NCGR_PEP_ID=MMETSP0200_2-20121128/7715_1 /TAXON_ID=947934 /ORGANISM="Chaetoceros sp., Strain GSL56" /LENGTH=668 /DNA_ID=CAMNT_0017887433 /DNA_START=73 /DNA_END=2076 /DNA_ORIENTATION=-
MPNPSSILDPQDTFATLCTSVGLDIRLRKGLSRLGYVRPTLVQSKCLPLAITSGRDLLVRARTGSGKTLAYCLPILHKILSKQQHKHDGHEEEGFVKAVILVPTRELCTQVTNTLNSLIYYCDEVISVTTLYSGKNSSETAMLQQEAMLRDRPDVLVSTPAGLLAHIERDGSLLKITLKHSVESLVVDEADLVLSFGYASDVTEIMKYLPKICQGFLMSATLSLELNSLKKVVLHSPAVLKLEEDTDTKDAKVKQGSLTQFYLTLPKTDKNLVIYVFLKLGLLKGKGLFFVNTIDSGYRLKLFLEQFHIRSAVLNAELPLRSRLNIIEQYNVGNFDYLIATDDSTDAGHGQKKNNAEEEDMSDDDRPKKKSKSKRKKDSEYGVARGLDFRAVSFVVNVDFPPSPESYTHRVGRTARGGANGVAFSLVEEDSVAQMDMLAQVQETQPPLLAAANRAADHLQTAAPTMREDGSDEDNDHESHVPQTIPQPSPLDFDLKEIEGFRYRVEDVGRAVTKNLVRETRAAELKAEILNSQRLQNHFTENPSELQLLRHDRQATHASKVQPHLKHVPNYLLPRGMQVADMKRRKKRKHKGDRRGLRRTDNDPLQSYDGENVNLDSVAESNANGLKSTNDDDEFDDPLATSMEEGGVDDDDQAADGNGRSTSGRAKW